VTVQDGGALTWFNWRAWADEGAIRAWTVWTRDEAQRWTLRIHGASERVLEVPTRGPGSVNAVAIAPVTRGATEGEAWVMRRVE
jgi:hypothetical protein